MLRQGAPTADYWWVQSGLDDVNRRVVASAVAEMASNRELPIAYSPIYDGIYFDFENGMLRYNGGALGHGLTCATFIMAVFDALGLALFKVEEWKARPEDAVWRAEIVRMLRETCSATDEHVDAILNRPAGARFRPEEVAGSVTETTVPVAFDRAQVLGRQVLSEMAAPRPGHTS